MDSYREFLSRKIATAPKAGIEPRGLPSCMKPHQADATAFALRTGRAGLYLDTGLGKTLCELEFCRQAAEATNGRALILTPLAVAKQFEREASKFGIEARVIREQSDSRDGINICNYDRVDKLEPESFGAIALDESSILKAFAGATSRALRAAFAAHRFRLSATATPAPNDHMELGQHAEFLGVMNSVEMLSKFFINDTSTASQQWRLKGHAEQSFWDWFASFAVMAERPSDITGDPNDDSEFVLPPLRVTRHHVESDTIDADFGEMFGNVVSATNMFDIKRKTQMDRVRLAAAVVLGDIECRLKASVEKPDITQTQSTVHADGHKTTLGSARNIEPTQPTSVNSRNTTPPNMQRPRLGSGSNTDLSGTGLQPNNTPRCSRSRMVDAQSAEAKLVSTSITVIGRAPCEEFSATDVISPSDFLKMTKGGSQQPLPTCEAWVIWCDTNEEQSLLERELGDAAISIRGSMSADQKEELHDAWLAGARPILISKVSIFGYGVNWQHCCNMFFLGRSFSYESWYQAVRRCWRFGQARPVTVHIAVAEGEDQIGRVIERKSSDHIRMKRMMSAAMRRALGREVSTKVGYEPKHYAELPAWLMAS